MSEAQREEPEWVKQMRAAGYNIRGGRGEPIPEIPDAFFYPPPTFANRMKERLGRAFRKVVRALTPTRRTSHAPLP